MKDYNEDLEDDNSWEEEKEFEKDSDRSTYEMIGD